MAANSSIPSSLFDANEATIGPRSERIVRGTEESIREFVKDGVIAKTLKMPGFQIRKSINGPLTMYESLSIITTPKYKQLFNLLI